MCLLLFRLMDHLPHSVQTLSTDGVSTGEIEVPTLSHSNCSGVKDLERSCALDEVARFLLHVKTLDYQDEPDYQHLQDVLSSGSSEGLDFCLPTAGPLNQVPEQRIRALLAMLPVPGCSLNCCVLPLPSAASSGQACSWRRNAILHQFITTTS